MRRKCRYRAYYHPSHTDHIYGFQSDHLRVFMEKHGYFCIFDARLAPYTLRTVYLGSWRVRRIR